MKSAPSNRCSSPDWLSLADDTIAIAQAKAQAANLTGALGFILDGDGAPNEACLYDRWLPLMSTFIDSPWEALFSDEPRRLPNGTSPPGYEAYDRFQVLDSTESEWPLLSALDYGKFGNTTRSQAQEYPMLLWEPSGQENVDSESRSYLSTKASPHRAQLLFASNTDPLMHQLYAAPLSGQGWSVAFNEWNAPVQDGKTTPVMPLMQSKSMGEEEGEGFVPSPDVIPVILTAGSLNATAGTWSVLLLGDS